MQKKPQRIMKSTALLLSIANIVALCFFMPVINTGDAARVNGRETHEGAQAPSTTGTPSPYWRDDFNGPQGTLPDANKWAFDTQGNKDGWGNQQLEYDTKGQNAYLDGQGHLVLEARKNTSSSYKCWYGTCQYTSAHLITLHKFSFTYGYVEARIKSPTGKGLWPAFWLLGDNVNSVGWPQSGEIDIMEILGNDPTTVNGTVHGPGYGSGGIGKAYKLPQGSLADDYHVYAVSWSPDEIDFFLDGNNYFTVSKATVEQRGQWVFDHPFYLILNVAVGGSWPGSPDDSTVFPQQMLVDYVSVNSGQPTYN